MVKGRSNYNIPFIGSRDSINNLILDYLSKNAFSPSDDETEQYYENKEKTRGFKYIITTGNINISAWVNDPEGGEIAIENNALKSECNDYKKSLSVLFNDINILNSRNYSMIQDKKIQKEKEPMNYHDVISTIGVWLAVLGLVFSIFNKKFAIAIMVIDGIALIYSFMNNRKKQGTIISILFVISIITLVVMSTINSPLPK